MSCDLVPFTTAVSHVYVTRYSTFYRFISVNY